MGKNVKKKWWEKDGALALDSSRQIWELTSYHMNTNGPFTRWICRDTGDVVYFALELAKNYGPLTQLLPNKKNRLEY